MSEDEAIFIQAVQMADSLPLPVREQAESVQSCERRVFDQSYLDFLREQIALEPRGPEWTAILMRRLSALTPFCGAPTLSATIPTMAGDFCIRVDAQSRQVIHYEQYEPAGNV